MTPWYAITVGLIIGYALGFLVRHRIGVIRQKTPRAYANMFLDTLLGGDARPRCQTQIPFSGWTVPCCRPAQHPGIHHASLADMEKAGYTRAPF